MTDDAKSDGRRDRRARSRERIIEATFLIVQRGNWRPTVTEIAAQAGVSVRTVFDIFGTIEGVYEELMRTRGLALRYTYADAINAVVVAVDADITVRLILMGRLPVTEPQQEPV